jgi:hypothetical protein
MNPPLIGLKQSSFPAQAKEPPKMKFFFIITQAQNWHKEKHPTFSSVIYFYRQFFNKNIYSKIYLSL